MIITSRALGETPGSPPDRAHCPVADTGAASRGHDRVRRLHPAAHPPRQPLRHIPEDQLHEHDCTCQPNQLDADRRHNPPSRRGLDRRPHPAQTRHERDDRDADSDQNRDEDPGADQLVLDSRVALSFLRLIRSGRNEQGI
jgi:hypothetical protein